MNEVRENGLKMIKFIISDLHLGHGWEGRLEDNLEAFQDDKIFAHFIKMLIKRYKDSDTKVNLILNGDTFDPLAIPYKGKNMVIPYERVDLYKIKKIIKNHPYIFNALRLFLGLENFKISFIIGNHDLCLHWPSVKEAVVERLGKYNASRIHFVTEITEGNIYISHGNTEYHNKTSPNPITDQTILVAFKRDGWRKMLKEEMFEKEKVLDVPLGHHLVVALQNPLKKYNLLVGHMRQHGFVWLDAIFGMFRENHYRKHRLFFAIAVITTIWVTMKYWWYTKDRGIIKKILRVLGWTITNALEGQRPRDEAIRLLERDDIDIVIFGHEHVHRYETIRVGPKNKLYLNSGTWQLMREVQVPPIKLKWRRAQKLERILKRAWRYLVKFLNPEIKDITECPVVEISYSQDGSRFVKLLRFSDEKRELEEFV